MRKFAGAHLSLWALSFVSLFFLISDPFGWVFYAAVYGFLGLTAAGLFWIGYVLWKRRILMKILSVIPFILGMAFAIVGLALAIDYKLLIPGFPAHKPTPEEWQADFAALKEHLSKHPIFSDSLNADSLFDQSIDFRSLSTDESLVALMRTIGQIPDGHSYIHPFQPSVHADFLPLQGYWFDDGYYIVRAANKYKKLVGRRLNAINNHTAEDLLRDITPLVGADNPWNAKNLFDQFVFSGNVLRGLKIMPDPNTCIIKSSDSDGNTYEDEVDSESFIPWVFWALKPIKEHRPLPALMNLRSPNYYIEIDSVTSTAFVTLHLIQSSKGYGLKAFADDIDRSVTGSRCAKIVFDLRNSLGGDNTRYKPLLEAVAKHKECRVFVFTSRKTFSASVNFISDLKNTREMTLIGEPTGAGANHYGDPEHLLLPATKTSLFLSTKAWVFDSLDQRKQYDPDVLIRYRYQDYERNSDPWLEALDRF